MNKKKNRFKAVCASPLKPGELNKIKNALILLVDLDEEKVNDSAEIKLSSNHKYFMTSLSNINSAKNLKLRKY
jgi:hypothetical protein